LKRAPHVVGYFLCCTRCWYLYQVDQAWAAQSCDPAGTAGWL